MKLLEESKRKHCKNYVDKDFLDKTTDTQAVKQKTDKTGLRQAKNFLHSKGINQQSAEAMDVMKENICKLCI